MPAAGLLITCSESDTLRIEEAVRKLSWDGDGRGTAVYIAAIPVAHVRDATYVAGRIHERAREIESQRRLTSRETIEVFVMQGIAMRERLRGNLDLRPERPSVAALERRLLRDALEKLRLDWRSRVEDLLQFSWLHGAIPRSRIDAWLHQFDMLSSHGWVGERLLRALSFWPGSRLLESLNLTAASLAEFGHICVNTQTIGKSASVVSNQVKKHLESLTGVPTKTVEDLREVLEEEGDRPILYIEDCLISGTETCSLFRSLLNEVVEGRRPKTSPLTDPERLRNRRIEMRFGVVANFGSAIFEEFAAQRKLSNIEIAHSGVTISTLTEEGIQAVRNGSLIDEMKCLRDSAKHVRAVVFSATALWDTPERVTRAKTFCQVVGAQLWSRYLASRSWIWDQRRIEECGLGMRGQALALAFAHSVPKSSLPLFWYGGEVKFGTRTLTWEPLFPNAS